MSAARAKVCQRSRRRLTFEQFEDRRLLAGLVVEATGGITGSVRDSPFEIVFNYGPEIRQRPEAIEALETAANEWRSHIADQVTLFIDVDFADLDSGVLGQAVSVPEFLPYDELHTLMMADATNEPKAKMDPEDMADSNNDELDDEIVKWLPEPNELKFNLPPGTSFFVPPSSGQGFGNINVPITSPGVAFDVNSATLKALGYFQPTNPLYLEPDATIEFNSAEEFDFDMSNGVDSDKFSFLETAIHEIGHVLGFKSSLGPGPVITPTPLDLFRFTNTVGRFDPIKADQFGTFTRELRTTVATVSDFVLPFWGNSQVEYEMAGDISGNQPSHWEVPILEQDQPIGVMDAQANLGEISSLSDADLRALDLIGWDILAPREDPEINECEDLRRNPMDVDCDGHIAPNDALMVIDELNGSTAEGESTSSRYRPTDVDRDGFTAPLDALLIINHLNGQAAAAGEAPRDFDSPSRRTDIALLSYLRDEKPSQTGHRTFSQRPREVDLVMPFKNTPARYLTQFPIRPSTLYWTAR